MQAMIPTFLGRMRGHWLELLQVHLIFTLLGIAILGPMFGLLLQTAVGFSGEAAVADQDIARLLLTPLGLSFAVFLAGILLTITALELGALVIIVRAAQGSLQCSPLQACSYAIRQTPGLLHLTLLLTLNLGARTIPLLLVIGLAAWLLLTDHDINFYLAQKPPELWWAIAVAALALPIYAWFVGRTLLRWCLALPLVLFDHQSGQAALIASEDLTAGKVSEALCAYAMCLAVAALLGIIPHILLDLIGGWIVNAPYERLAPLVFMLGALVAGWLVMNFFTAALGLASIAFVTAELYSRFGAGPIEEHLQAEPSPQSRIAQGRGAWRITAVVFVLAGMAVLVGARLVDIVQAEDSVVVVAHRGAAGAAPENTLAAVRRAIADEADWVEIDVQESRDGHVVVFHDSDFMKLSGNPLKIWDADLIDIQQQDIGSWFSAQFAGERVPTLAQILEEVRGRARLMIELKYYGHDQQLEQRVIDLVESAGMVDQVSIMSLKLAGVQKVQSLRPEWEVGLLAATAVGDISKVDVDFLALSERMVTTQFIRRVHAGDKRVLVWTVNDAPSLSKWMSMGVDGVITDEPALARQVLAERAQMNTAERLLVSVALFLGKPVAPNSYRDDSP
jgi:glycerophosphoryl diester phosphodiesterase